MDQMNKSILEIRERAAEAEAKELMRRWENRYPDEKMRAHKVWQRMNAKYGTVRSKQLTVISDQLTVNSKQLEKKRLTLEELCQLPLEGCEITVTIGSIDPRMLRKRETVD